MERRRFSVWTNTKRTTGEITKFFVCDADTEAELEFRTPVVEFPISHLYEAREQKARAAAYRDFMNRIVDATDQAYKDNALVDILKGDV